MNDFPDIDEQENEQQFHKLLKKTRRKTLIRNIFISVLSTFIIVAGLLIANQMLLTRSNNSAHSDIYHYKQISDPNVLLGESQGFDSIWSGTAAYKTYKVIEGVPIPWAEKNYRYNVLGQFSLFNGGYSPLSVIDPDMDKLGLNMARPYNALNGQRELLFFHPEVHYPKIMNELNQLMQIGAEKKVEMAISLDHAYTAKEIRSMLPSGVHPRWFWVDTYTADYIKFLNGPPTLPISTSIVYGYSAYSDMIEGRFENNEENFISFVKEGLKLNGKYDWEYKQIFNQIRGDKADPTANDIHNIGVVVTGSPAALQALQNKTYVRGAVLGAIVDKY